MGHGGLEKGVLETLKGWYGRTVGGELNPQSNPKLQMPGIGVGDCLVSHMGKPLR